MAFRGHFDYSLDAKNRLNVPAKFRAAFSSGVVLAKALEPCVAVWAPDTFERWTESFLSNLNPVSPERRKLTRYFAGSSFDVELDSAGRVMVPPAHRGFAGIDRQVMFVGTGEALELWDLDAWNAYETDLTARASELTAALGHPA